jgi:hypothetical protein
MRFSFFWGLSNPLTTLDTEPRVAGKLKTRIAGFWSNFRFRLGGPGGGDPAFVQAEDACGENAGDL